MGVNYGRDCDGFRLAGPGSPGSTPARTLSHVHPSLILWAVGVSSWEGRALSPMMSHGADGSYHLSSARLPPKLSSFKRWRALELREVKHPSPGHPARGRAGTQPPSLSLLLLFQLYPSCLLPLFWGGAGGGRKAPCVHGTILEIAPPGPAPPDLEEGSEAPDRQSASRGAAQPGNL